MQTKTRQDTTKQYNKIIQHSARKDKPIQHKTKQDEAIQYMTRQGKLRQCQII